MRVYLAGVIALLTALGVAGCTKDPKPTPFPTAGQVYPTPTGNPDAQFRAQAGFMLSCPGGVPKLTTFLFTGAQTIPPAPKDLLDKLVEAWELGAVDVNGTTECRVTFHVMPGTTETSFELGSANSAVWQKNHEPSPAGPDGPGNIGGPQVKPGESFLMLCSAPTGSKAAQDKRLPAGVGLQWTGTKWIPPFGIPAE